ncbi:MAG: carbohydrate porin [Endomicrobium sp.]|nr:carbohydrate porin [Endomicrobium sp.]
MKKKTIVVLTVVSIFMLVSKTSKVLAADSLAEQFGIQVTGSGTIVIQGTPRITNLKETQTPKKDSKYSATYLLSLKLIKEFENNGKILVRFKAGRGLGLEAGEGEKNSLTYAQVNASADSTDFKGNILVKITELFYQQSFINDKLTIDFGKLDSGPFAENKYAKDKTSQFITGTFTTDKTINSMPQHLALRLNYTALDILDISYAYYIKDIDHIDSGSFNIVQANYKPFKSSNYRAYLWADRKHHSYTSETYGLGISADQKIDEIFAVFGRLGYKNLPVNVMDITKNSDSFNLPLSLTWSVGTEIKGTAWSRDNDAFGFAIGQIYGSSKLKKCKNNKIVTNNNYKSNAETEIELYYKLTLNNHVAITPAIQYIRDPNGKNSSCNSDMLIYGIRTQFDF